MPGCSWRGHLRGVHIHYCPGVLGRDTCEGYTVIIARVFLEGTPARGTQSLLPGCSWKGHLRGVHIHYCPSILGGDTCEGYIFITARVECSWRDTGMDIKMDMRMVLTEDVVRSLSAPIYCRDLDTTTLRDLIDFDGKLIPKDLQPGVPRVGIPRPPRASMQDLYE
ncbi:hypothetical protein Tco_1274388 [Tanacetum coccineum]